MGEPATRVEKRELGVELLAHLEYDEISLAAAIDRIETVTSSPSLTREILDTAEKRGIIDRNGAQLAIRRGGTYVDFDTQVEKRSGKFECKRCGSPVSTGYFIIFESGTLGPFGSSCIRVVTGRR